MNGTWETVNLNYHFPVQGERIAKWEKLWSHKRQINKGLQGGKSQRKAVYAVVQVGRS